MCPFSSIAPPASHVWCTLALEHMIPTAKADDDGGLTLGKNSGDLDSRMLSHLRWDRLWMGYRHRGSWISSVSLGHSCLPHGSGREEIGAHVSIRYIVWGWLSPCVYLPWQSELLEGRNQFFLISTFWEPRIWQTTTSHLKRGIYWL